MFLKLSSKFVLVALFATLVYSLSSSTPVAFAQTQVSLYPGQTGVFTLKYINAGDSDAITSAITSVSLNDSLEYVPGFLNESFGGGTAYCVADSIGGGIVSVANSAATFNYRPRSSTTTAAPCNGAGTAGSASITAAPEATPGDQSTWPAAKVGTITFRAKLRTDKGYKAGDVVNFAVIGETTLDGGSGGAASLKIGVVGAPDLVTADIPGLTLSCGTGGTVTVKSTTTCTFNLPVDKSLPPTFKLGIGDAAPAGSCVLGAANLVTCSSVPTGNLLNQQPISAQIASGPKTDTGEKVNVIATPALITPLVTADIPGLSVNCTAAQVNSTTTCTFNLPADKSVPANMTLSIGNAGTQSNPCTANGNTVTCSGVPTGSTAGQQVIFGKIGSDPKTDTGEKANISALPVVLPRTGGETYIIIGLIAVSGLVAGGVFAFSRRRKIKVN